ncbi:hypothetical protein GTU73_11415 [Rathayibacter sp. VKM Ac-2804]|uniref:hypothetical protein n=1 Tax=Rathayibacter sp. VKM Ac-2804 TaxID=2609257 RepID=UPI00132EC53B|nr:hypothetical protein [Rathayibacter sp. VKM Ac-2804]QHF24559.1 hypothetical protein GTU73_11415 [Rathayibacter sp. VKM Ac-2804]
MTDYFPKVWICVVYAAVCAVMGLAFLASVFLGHPLSLVWVALAIWGLVFFARRAQRLHRRGEQQ